MNEYGLQGATGSQPERRYRVDTTQTGWRLPRDLIADVTEIAATQGTRPGRNRRDNLTRTDRDTASTDLKRRTRTTSPLSRASATLTAVLNGELLFNRRVCFCARFSG
jgi:hypothetical protein